MSENTEQATEQIAETAHIPVTVHIDPAALLGAYRYGDDLSLGDVLTERIVDRAAERIVEKILDDALSQTVRDLVAARVNEVVTARLEEPIQAVNEWGSRIGKSMTIREHIGKAVEEWPKERSGYDRATNLQKWISDQVDRAAREDLSGALKQARDQVAERLRSEAARLLAEQATPGGRR